MCRRFMGTTIGIWDSNGCQIGSSRVENQPPAFDQLLDPDGNSYDFPLIVTITF